MYTIARGLIVFFIGVLLLTACANGSAQRAAELLARDYQSLSDPELQAYYSQLTDQLARETRAQRLEAASRNTKPEDDETLARLRSRWNEVRQEIRLRQQRP